MITTVVAVLCHAVLAGANSSAIDVCHEEIVHKGDSMQECLLFPADLAQWKEAGRFKGEEWRIARVKCMPGSYERKDEL